MVNTTYQSGDFWGLFTIGITRWRYWLIHSVVSLNARENRHLIIYAFKKNINLWARHFYQTWFVWSILVAWGVHQYRWRTFRLMLTKFNGCFTANVARNCQCRLFPHHVPTISLIFPRLFAKYFLSSSKKLIIDLDLLKVTVLPPLINKQFEVSIGMCSFKCQLQQSQMIRKYEKT